ncbi:MAG: TRAM domain-containing protein, partial [Desulfuromusa sp.]|nr:TRAM domain-containing protein [Desulfuromusa sp.]
PRIETAAAEMEDNQSKFQKQQRFNRLLELQQRISAEIWQEDANSVQKVLVEGLSKQGEGQLFGRTTWNRIVNFSGSKELIGQIVTIKISKVFRNSHLGELVES